MKLNKFMAWCDRHLVEIRETILTEARPDSCIFSTAVLVKYINRQLPDVQIEPLAVRVLIYNEPYMIRLTKRGNFPPEKVLETWVRKYNAHVMGISKQTDNDLVGHLVAIVTLEDGKVLVDLTLDQTTRPDKGIHPRPISYPLVDDELFTGRAVGFMAKNADQSLYKTYTVVYEMDPDQTGFIFSPDWIAKRNRKLHMTVLEKLPYEPIRPAE